MRSAGFLLLCLLIGSDAAAQADTASCDSLTLATSEQVTADQLAVYQAALAGGRYQEVLWALRDSGDQAQADAVSTCLERILTGGKVIGMERRGGGISSTFDVRLERGVAGIFKTTNSFKGCYRHELAAYALDRRLGLHIVPMTVARSIDGREGSLQYFLADAVPAYQAESPRKNAELKILDILIDNEDRHAANWLVYELGGVQRVAAIDHNLSFSCRKEAHLSATAIRNLSPAEAADMKARLESLSENELEELLDDYVSRSRAIRKAQKAREKILRRLAKLAQQ